jgi:hypothetical protein
MLGSAAADTFSNALQQVGLTLESRQAPLDVLVIDAITRRHPRTSSPRRASRVRAIALRRHF